MFKRNRLRTAAAVFVIDPTLPVLTRVGGVVCASVGVTVVVDVGDGPGVVTGGVTIGVVVGVHADAAVSVKWVYPTGTL